MKLHRSLVGDCHIQTILVESVKLGYVIHDLEVGEYQNFENRPPSFLKFHYPQAAKLLEPPICARPIFVYFE